MEFEELLGVAGVTFVTLIIGVIGAAKRVLPKLPFVGKYLQDIDNDLWFAVSIVLGIIAQSAIWLATIGVPSNGLEWLTLVVLGGQFGLSAGKAYDEAKK